MQIRDGWASDTASTRVGRQLSPNKTAGHRSRECIVLHYTAGYTAASAIRTFENKAVQASAHFVVETDGAITQIVNCNDTAWHAGYGVFRGGGQVNARSIGIEMVNPGYHFRSSDGGYLNWQRKPVTAASLRPFPDMIEAHDPWVGSAATWWPTYPEAQLRAVETLIKACLKAWPTIQEIVGHRDVDTVRRLKVDPGPAFPMARMRRLLSDRADPADLGGTPMVVRVANSVLNIRGGPGTSFEKLDRGPLANGAKVTALEVRGEWIRVRVGTGDAAFEGWCFGAYLQPG